MKDSPKERAIELASGVAGEIAEVAITALSRDPFLGAVAGPFLDTAATLLLRRATVFWQPVREAGISPSEFVESIQNDERVFDLLRDASEAAARTSLDEKIRALGSALLSGLMAKDDAQIEEAIIIVDALRELEAIHIRVLRILEEAPPMEVPPADGSTARPMRAQVSREKLAAELDNPERVLNGVLAPLEAQHLVENSAIGLWDYSGNPEWSLTDFGQALLDLLRESGQTVQS
jgi:hypothetical protein